jgi:hypothetical protein
MSSLVHVIVNRDVGSADARTEWPKRDLIPKGVTSELSVPIGWILQLTQWTRLIESNSRSRHPSAHRRIAPPDTSGLPCHAVDSHLHCVLRKQGMSSQVESLPSWRGRTARAGLSALGSVNISGRPLPGKVN